MEILYTSERITNDPSSRELIASLQDNADDLGLSDAFVYYDFPRYADYESQNHQPDVRDNRWRNERPFTGGIWPNFHGINGICTDG